MEIMGFIWIGLISIVVHSIINLSRQTSGSSECDDPIKSCTRYKELGCSHADGILCDFPACSFQKLDFDITGFSTNHIGHGFVYLIIRNRSFVMMYSYRPETIISTCILYPTDDSSLLRAIDKYPPVIECNIETTGGIRRCIIPTPKMRRELMELTGHVVQKYQNRGK